MMTGDGTCTDLASSMSMLLLLLLLLLNKRRFNEGISHCLRNAREAVDA